MANYEVEPNLASVPMPPRKGRLEMYLWDYGDEVSARIAEDFYDPARPVQPYGVLIPVAAHQEAEWINKAMSQYAAQEGAGPFTIFLLLNHPKDAESQNVGSCRAEVERARNEYPALDIRVAQEAYSKPTIGQIRKDLWDAATRVALADGLYATPGQEFIGINHDIDTVRIGCHYIQNIQHYYRSLQRQLNDEDLSEEPMPSRHTQVKHAYPFATHPNVARAIFWSDFRSRQIGRNGTYEEGLVIPLCYYAANGGFDPAYITHETRDVSPRNLLGISGTVMETSPRRYVARLGEHGIAGIWSEESFTPTDECRELDKLPGDITYRELEDIILSSLDDTLFYFGKAVPRERLEKIVNKAVMDPVADSMGVDEYISSLDLSGVVSKELSAKFRLARRVLETIVGVPAVAELIDEERLAVHVNNLERAVKDAIKDDLLLFR